MTDTAQRARSVDFVNFSAGTTIIVQRGNPAGLTDITDLCGKVVAVEVLAGWGVRDGAVKKITINSGR